MSTTPSRLTWGIQGLCIYDVKRERLLPLSFPDSALANRSAGVSRSRVVHLNEPWFALDFPWVGWHGRLGSFNIPQSFYRRVCISVSVCHMLVSM